MKKILLFQLKPVCYDSYIYFADALGNAFLKLGFTVEYFNSAKEPLEALERLIGCRYDAIFDFNSDLPKLQMDDDSYFLDHLDAPFYDIILDHPLYHHDMLKHPLHNFHVLCLDDKHCLYIRKNYPHIKDVHRIAMTGSTAALEEKSIPLLFSGSYTNYRQVAYSIRQTPAFIAKLTWQLIDLMLADAALSQEEALTLLLPELDEIVTELFSLHMQACFFADTYLRAYRREQILSSIANSGLALTLCGNGWKEMPVSHHAKVTYIPDTTFSRTFSLMSQSQITLNIMPGFTAGTHDRIYSAMLNHSLSVTDATPVLKSEFTDGKDFVFYDAEEPQKLTETLFELLTHPDKIASIAESGYQKSQMYHTWDCRAKSIMELLL